MKMSHFPHHYFPSSSSFSFSSPPPNYNNNYLPQPPLSQPPIPLFHNDNTPYDPTLLLDSLNNMPNNQHQYESMHCSGIGLAANNYSTPPSTLPPNNAKKKLADRHSKICTARGLRDRRVRLSIDIAREFFDLHDTLGFDKASETLEWLLKTSKKAIHELISSRANNDNHCSGMDRVVRDSGDDQTLEDVVSRVNDPEPDTEPPGSRLVTNKELRANARARARARTNEKKRRRCSIPRTKTPTQQLRLSCDHQVSIHDAQSGPTIARNLTENTYNNNNNKYSQRQKFIGETTNSNDDDDSSLLPQSWDINTSMVIAQPIFSVVINKPVHKWEQPFYESSLCQ